MEIIDRVKQMIADGVLKQEDAEKYIPELKESEDERIRKEIIDFVKSRGGFKGDWIAWLEKQGGNNWKPSDEQIKVCKEVYADILSAKGFDLGTVNSELNRLEEELRKLKE